MYLWNVNGLAQELKENTLPAREKVKYLILFMLYIPTGLLGSNWIPGLYRFIYRLTNEYMAKEAPDVKALKIFSDFNYITDLIVIVLIWLCVLIAYHANQRGDKKRFLERFLCLAVSVSFRVGVYVLVIFLTVLFASLIFFNYKLQHIAVMSGLLKPLRQLNQLQTLSSIMTFISMRMHIFSCVMTGIAALWSGLMIRTKIKYIAKPKER
ncbi:hypothetical protein JW872_00730 [Candidatus Babeliales bacterium]|nr:hypothetical protein [Candidatus Babeliales bacterium]